MRAIEANHRPDLHVVDTIAPSHAGQALVISFHKINPSDDTSVNSVKLSIPDGLPPQLKTLIEDCMEDGSFTAEAKEKYTVRLPPQMTDCVYKHLVLLGAGQAPGNVVYQGIGKELLSIAKDLKASNIDLILGTMPDTDTDSNTHTCTSMEEKVYNVLLGLEDISYDDKRYKGVVDDNNNVGISTKKSLEKVSFTGISTKDMSSVTNTVHKHSLISSGVAIAKDLVGAPPNSKTPLAISLFARNIAAMSDNIECQVLGQEECEAANMGGFLAVQQGSKFPPQFVHMTYKNKNTKNGKKIALIGKGLTFDSGGYNLKVGAGSLIEMMKFDMGGMGAVLGTAAAVASLDSSSSEGGHLFDGLEIHFISAVCENMISRDAMRPGDIVTASNGKTIEIINTGQ
jgi:leucyl aminopeptidase